jgi:hypothetical protein
MRTGIVGAWAVLLATAPLVRAQALLPAPSSTVQYNAAGVEVLPGYSSEAGPGTSANATEFAMAGTPLLGGGEPYTDTGAYDEGDSCGAKGCGRPGLFWTSAEYLLWWTKDAEIPAPLLTTGQGASEGILGQPGTFVRYGLNNVDYDVVSGFRLSGGIHNKCHTLGLMGSGFFLQDQTANFDIFSNAIGVPVLARPIIDVSNLTESALLISSPGEFAGGFFVDASSRFWGAEVNGVLKVASDDVAALDVILGYRHLDLDENFQIGQVTQLLPGTATGFNGQVILAPATISIRDGFETRNQFNGAQVGTLLEVNIGKAYCYIVGKVALGSTQQTLLINGNTGLFRPGADPINAPGGLLAVASNIGSYERNEFTVVPEVDINFGYQVFPWMRAYIGYTFLYWSSVARPSQQIDRIINLNQVPVSTTFNPLLGLPRPVPTFDQSNFWAQGINFGLAFRF